MDADELTPTQDLIMFLMVSRKRLGESVVLVSSKHLRALVDLDRRGLLKEMGSGSQPKTRKVMLTEKGWREHGADYETPLEKRCRTTEAALDNLLASMGATRLTVDGVTTGVSAPQQRSRWWRRAPRRH